MISRHLFNACRLYSQRSTGITIGKQRPNDNSSQESPINSLNVIGSFEAPRLPSVTRVHDRGFTVGNVRLQGGVVLIDGAILCWDPPAFADLTPAHFSIFEALKTPTELVIIGTGRDMHPLPESIVKMLRACGVQWEVMNSRRAAATYNILIEEDRPVAACLLPQTPISAREPHSPDTDEQGERVNVV
eukprot:Partr_v1_DN26870_c0_g1_i1_m40964 putative NADH dehydrogenase (ubiquinone) complex I, assembly factor 3